jgi:hypothetical protein
MTEGFRSDFYISIRDEIERIVDEMKEEKRITKSVIERIKSIQRRLEAREDEKRKFKEIFPIFVVIRDYFPDIVKAQEVSKILCKSSRIESFFVRRAF